MELLLGGLGLLLALYQIRRAEKAAIAAKEAVERTMAQTNVYTLLLLIPEVVLVEREMSRMASADDLDATQSLIRDWQSRASELKGLLKEYGDEMNELETKVQESLVLAGLAQGTLNKKSSKPSSATRVLRACTSEVVVLARTEGARVRARKPESVSIPTLGDDLVSLGRRIRDFFKRGK